MKKVKYVGEFEAVMPSLNVSIKPGDIIEVDDDFYNSNFIPVEDTKKKGDK